MFSSLLAHLHAPIYRKRLRVLTELIQPHLRNGDVVLDVGCGAGTLAAALAESSRALEREIRVEGVERYPRGGEPIPVTPYPGGRFPFADHSFDVVIVADVLHHEEDPHALLRECIRVSRRLVVIKDHQLRGLFAKARVSLIDWAANAPYGAQCLYRYNSAREWESIFRELHLKPIALFRRMNLYPVLFNFLFGRRLQYLAVCEIPAAATAAPKDRLPAGSIMRQPLIGRAFAPRH